MKVQARASEPVGHKEPVKVRAASPQQTGEPNMAIPTVGSYFVTPVVAHGYEERDGVISPTTDRPSSHVEIYYSLVTGVEEDVVWHQEVGTDGVAIRGAVYGRDIRYFD